MENFITARKSLLIDKQLSEIKNIIEKYDNYYYTKDPKETLSKMKDEIYDIFNCIFDDIL